MAFELLSVLRFAVVSSLPGTAAQGDAVVLTSNGHLYVYDGSGWVDHGATGAGGLNSGTATIDFGAFPGTVDASVVITGQAGIATSSKVLAWLMPKDTADHTADEHLVDGPVIVADASSIVAGTGFTIRGLTREEPGGADAARNPRDRSARDSADCYGLWTVAWLWI